MHLHFFSPIYHPTLSHFQKKSLSLSLSLSLSPSLSHLYIGKTTLKFKRGKSNTKTKNLQKKKWEIA
jgi:hypothetical protein